MSVSVSTRNGYVIPMNLSLGVSLLLVVLNGACATADGHASVARREEGQPRKITRAVVEAREVTPVLTYMATIRAARDATLSSQHGGRVEHIKVALGDSVSAGEELLRLSDADARLASEGASALLAQARARVGTSGEPTAGRSPDVAAARVNFELASDARKRAEALYPKGSLSQQDLLRARSAEAIARAQLEAAEAQALANVAQLSQASAALSQSHLVLREMTLRAPFAGLVVELWARKSEIAAPGTPMVRLVDVGSLEVEFELPQHEAKRVSVGTPVSIPTEAPELPALAGKVLRMSAGLTGDARARLVIATFVDPVQAARHVLPGARVRVAVTIGEPVARAVVPRAAVRSSAGVVRVFAIAGDTVSTRLLEPERLEGDVLLVRHGVTPGEHVVLSPPIDLLDGERVAR